MKKLQAQIVPLFEIERTATPDGTPQWNKRFKVTSQTKGMRSCPYLRLDPKHYLPIHHTWECQHKDKLRTKNTIINTWLKNKNTTQQFQLTRQHVK